MTTIIASAMNIGAVIRPNAAGFGMLGRAAVVLDGRGGFSDAD